MKKSFTHLTIFFTLILIGAAFFAAPQLKAANITDGLREVEIISTIRTDDVNKKRYQDITITTYLGAHDTIILDVAAGYPERLEGDPDYVAEYWTSDSYVGVWINDKLDPITHKSLNGDYIGKYTHYNQTVTLNITHAISHPEVTPAMQSNAPTDDEWDTYLLRRFVRIIDATTAEDVLYSDELGIYYSNTVNIVVLAREVTVDYLDYQTYFASEINEYLLQQIKDNITIEDTLTGTSLKENLIIYEILDRPLNDPADATEYYTRSFEQLTPEDVGINHFIMLFHNHLDYVPDDYIPSYYYYYLTITILEDGLDGLYLNGPDELTIEYGENINTYLSNYSANSSVDGDISENIVFDTSNVNNRLLNQSQNAIVKVTDSTNTTVAKEISIKIVDTVKPTFNILELSKTVTSKDDLMSFIASIQVSDNYDDNLTFTYNSSDVENWNSPSLYTLKLNTKDSSNNSTYLEVIIRWLDVEAPVIGGPSTFIIDVKDYINSSYLLNFYTAYDNKDGDLTQYIQIVGDTYKNNGARKGTYNLRLRVIDSSGNYATKNVSIRVVDGLRDYFIADKTIYVSKNHKLDDTDLSKALHYMTNKRNRTVIFDVFLQDYDTNYSNLGERFFGLVTGRDQYNSDIPSFMLNVEVVESNLFGQQAPNQLGDSFGTILVVGIVAVVVIVIINLFTKKRKWRV